MAIAASALWFGTAKKQATRNTVQNRQETSHSLVPLLLRLHHSLNRLLCTAGFARGHINAHSVTHSLSPELVGK